MLTAAKALAPQTNRTIGEVVSDLACASLRPKTEQGKRNGILLLPVRNPDAIVTPDIVNALHDAAHRLFLGIAGTSWATWPMTEDAVMRIVGHPKYPNSAGSPASVAPIVVGLRALAGHVFWADDLSLAASDAVDPSTIETPSQVTDTYLLALAISNGGRLATFDRRLSTRAVRGGPGWSPCYRACGVSRTLWSIG